MASRSTVAQIVRVLGAGHGVMGAVRFRILHRLRESAQHGDRVEELLTGGVQFDGQRQVRRLRDRQRGNRVRLHAQHGPAGRVRREAGAPGQQLGQLRTGHDQMGAPRPEVMNRRSRSGPPRVQLTPAYEADDREAGVN